MEVSSQLHAPTALPPGKELWFPLDRRLGGPQSRSGRGGLQKNIYMYFGDNLTTFSQLHRVGGSCGVRFQRTVSVEQLPLGTGLNHEAIARLWGSLEHDGAVAEAVSCPVQFMAQSELH
jgi:hypothetical protein